MSSELYDLQSTRRYFNRFWRLLHVPNALDTRAYEAFVEVARLFEAKAIFELGPGTGMLARHLTTHSGALQTMHLAEVSDSLCIYLRRRFASQPKITIEEVVAHPPFDPPSARFDRFISCFVLDCMDRETQRLYLKEAHRLLNDGGWFCAMSVTAGTTLFSRLLMSLGNFLSGISPQLALGARFIELDEALQPDLWTVTTNSKFVSMGFATRLLVAQKRVALVS